MEFIELGVQAQLIDAEAARRDAEDLAWEHARAAADAAGISLDGEAFEFLFTTLRTRYLELADHLEFLTYNGLILLRSLLNSGLIELGLDVPATEEEVANTLGRLSQIIVSSYAWMITGQDLLWPRNGTMPDTSVTFRFLDSDIITEQE